VKPRRAIVAYPTFCTEDRAVIRNRDS